MKAITLSILFFGLSTFVAAQDSSGKNKPYTVWGWDNSADIATCRLEKKPSIPNVPEEKWQRVPQLVGQAKIECRNVSKVEYSIYKAATEEAVCCDPGPKITTGRTDRFGHFVQNQLDEGLYFIAFDVKGKRFTTQFSAPKSYRGAGSSGTVLFNLRTDGSVDIGQIIHIED